MSRFRADAMKPPVRAEHEQDTDFSRSSTQFKRLAELLDYCRQQQRTLTYLEAADAIGVQPPHRIHQLTGLLEALMEYDQKKHLPLRAALVVSRARESLPAEGFFLKAQALNLMPAVTAEQFHQQCLKRLFCGPRSSENKQ